MSNGSKFDPVAIVGQGCILPQADSPEALWQHVVSKTVLYKDVPATALGLSEAARAGRIFASAMVDERMPDPNELDPVCRWSLDAAKQAWRDAGSPTVAPGRAGVYAANLAYPSRAHAAYAADIWTKGTSKRNSESVLNASHPPHLIATELGLSGPAYSLDAACASSLYALEIGCRRLQSGLIDCALIVGVNAADNLILHIGFEALQALSPTGRSRPFVAGADGLVPSEGAVAVVLKRLADVEPSEVVHGVIRGIGVSNDGRRKGYLAPSADGQIEAMQKAYEMAEIAPESIDYLECHATGTMVGDGTELKASAQIFETANGLKIGSLKGNMGHLVTAAGLASLLKVTKAMSATTLPPTPVDGTLIDGLQSGPLKVLTEPATWTRRDTPRRAAISNFGFGGNNAHLIVEQFEKKKRKTATSERSNSNVSIGIYGVGLRAGTDRGCDSVLRRLSNSPLHAVSPTQEIGADPKQVRIPPNDLMQAEPQQLAILDVVDEALNSCGDLPSNKTGVFVAMACAADSARWLLRERLSSRYGPSVDDVEDLDKVAPALEASTVLGAMANMMANRVTSSRDLRGQGFAISAGAASGIAALDAAIGALHAGTIDVAIVAAADFATEPVRAHALSMLISGSTPSDQAAALILKRSTDISDDQRMAKLGDIAWQTGEVSPSKALNEVVGYAPAASTIFEISLASFARERGAKLASDGAHPLLIERSKTTDVSIQSSPSNSAAQIKITPSRPRPSPDPLRPPPFLYWGSAASMTALAKRMQKGTRGGKGRFRIAISSHGEAQHSERMRAVSAGLLEGRTPDGTGIYFGDGPADGELAFMFTGSAAVYPRMGRGLLSAFPKVRRRLGKMEKAEAISKLLAKASLTEFEQLCTGTLIGQAHAILLLEELGLKPDAAIGLSLGESSALFAFGIWNDPGALLDEISEAAMYERHIGGTFETAQSAWGANVPADWSNWRVQAPVDKVRSILGDFPGVEITIIYTASECMIGGPADRCRAFCKALGDTAVTAKMNQHLIVHADAMRPFAETWRRLHTRKVNKRDDIRLYANAINGAYKPSSKKIAEMLTRQAVSTVDFPKTVEQAWADGVRTFVELGPRDTLTQSVNSVLGNKPHLAVATDRIDRSDLGQVAELAATLFADGREVDMKYVDRHLQSARQRVRPARPAFPVTRKVPYKAPQLPSCSETTGFPDPPLRPVCEDCELDTPLMREFKTVRFPPPPTPDPTPPRKTVSGSQPLKVRWPTGPIWERPALEASATGKMSALFGPEFRAQDKYARQVRLPAPPLLLVDRVTGITAERGVESTGVIWTETDLIPDAWYVHNGKIRPGPLIECGQADLTLIGWMGADFKNQNERVYRLLGCEITFHDGGLPAAGECLRFQIEITGHATLAGVRMFFFQYDCYAGERRVFSVRNGQAGFFTDEELASGKGVMWDPNTDAPPTEIQTAYIPTEASRRRAFDRDHLAAWRDGDGLACFGDGFKRLATHSKLANLPSDRLEFFDDVSIFEPAGGPWQRGYLKANAHVPRDAWFYEGHFHKDPCMPGTLMAEAAVQALEFFAVALGLTKDRDGYVFEPVPGQTAKFVCRGQVIPDRDHDISYEVFIDEIVDGEAPEIYASLLASCDGKKVFHCPRFGLRLRRDWPAPRKSDAPLRIGPANESRGDHAAMLDCANGPPSAAFGDMYTPFDTQGIVPRLPQPPYLLVSRITDVTTRPGQAVEGARVTAEYDIVPDDWYFDDNANEAMPFAVLSEIALQPCGWLASHCGFALSGELRFRNLQGDGTLYREVGRDAERLIVSSSLTSFSRVGPMTIVNFDVQVRDVADVVVFDLTTQFGFFPAAALARQAGLPPAPDFEAAFELPHENIDDALAAQHLARGRMKMIDSVDHFDPAGGQAGLGIIRGRQTVDPHAWYFKAHFFQDPVQPGSLGLDAICQLLARAVFLKGLANDMTAPHLETLATNTPITWTYRGQVMPDKDQVTSVVEVINVQAEPKGFLIEARGSLWSDELRVYEVKSMSVRLTDLG